jgi:hypothetical protein
MGTVYSQKLRIPKSKAFNTLAWFQFGCTMNQAVDFALPGSRRGIRQPISMTRSPSNPRPPQAPCSKTKSAVCFMCLFDGLRIPSINRLIRRPHSFCQLPLSLFDPSFFSPKANAALVSRYRSLFTGPCDCVVDPSIDTVQKLLTQHSNPSLNQRVVLHYFGFGCHAPTADGNLYFFTENRDRYFYLPVANYMRFCQAPLFLIFDCNNAGALYQAVAAARTSMRLDVIALFSCGRDQVHPIGADLPIDLFSQCLLNPFEMALWWHRRRYQVPVDAVENDRGMRGLFQALVDAIAVDSVHEHDLLFRNDPSVAALCRGFLVAHKILSSFRLTCLSIPEIGSKCDRHLFWDFWETAVDVAASQRCDVNEAIFDMLMKSFKSAPFQSAFPLFGYFMAIPEFHARVVTALLRHVDGLADPVNSPIARSQIWKSIVELKKVSADVLILLAKLIGASDIAPFDHHVPLAFSGTSDETLLRAAMLALICSFSRPCANSHHRLSMVCIQASDHCAPLNFVLFGLLADRAGNFLSLPECCERFADSLDSPKSDVRAAAAFALGCNRAEGRVDYLLPKLADSSWLVRYESILAIGKMLNRGLVEDVPEVVRELQMVEQDNVARVRDAATMVVEQLRSGARNDSEGAFNLELPRSLLLPLLVESVRRPNFLDAYPKNMFREDETILRSNTNGLL